MDAAEAKARIAAQDAELQKLEDAVGELAVLNPGPVLMAVVRGLVEITCAAQGEPFRKRNKIQFYRGVLAMLRSKGIS